jgi:hypothetical protein
LIWGDQTPDNWEQAQPVKPKAVERGIRIDKETFNDLFNAGDRNGMLLALYIHCRLYGFHWSTETLAKRFRRSERTIQYNKKLLKELEWWIQPEED